MHGACPITVGVRFLCLGTGLLFRDNFPAEPVWVCIGLSCSILPPAFWIYIIVAAFLWAPDLAMREWNQFFALRPLPLLFALCSPQTLYTVREWACRILWQDSQTPYGIVTFFTGIIVWILCLKAFLKQPSGIVPIFAVPASLFLPMPLLLITGCEIHENNENENGRIYFISLLVLCLILCSLYNP